MFIIEMCDTARTIKAGLNAIQSIQLAMVEGGVDPANWADGLLFVTSKLQDEADKLEQLIDDEEKRRNTEGRGEP
ncbi:MAG: hypothetical protein LUD78_04665 [Clostridiales bacterium]|nr:hypothetical protein [Clostridiales bacterium]